MNKTKFGILVWLFASVLLSVSCSQGTNQPGNSIPAISQTPISTKNEANTVEFVLQGKSSQTNEGNSVTIEASPQSKLTVESKELVFKIVMDTHSVNLDVYDLTSLAILRNNQGQQFKATSWQAPQGGHHRSGTLAFKSEQTILQKDTEYIELMIKDVANVPERVLRWELRAPG